MVDEIIAQDRSQSQRTLTGAVKTLLAEEDTEMRFEEISSLSTQGDMARRWNGCAAES